MKMSQYQRILDANGKHWNTKCRDAKCGKTEWHVLFKTFISTTEQANMALNTQMCTGNVSRYNAKLCAANKPVR